MLEIQPVHPKGNQSWTFIGRTDAEAKTLIFWPPDEKNWLIGKDPDAGKDLRQEEKEMTEDEMASPTQWTRVWVDSRSWWWTGRPGMLQSMGSQRVGHDWVTELNWTYFGVKTWEVSRRQISCIRGTEGHSSLWLPAKALLPELRPLGNTIFQDPSLLLSPLRPPSPRVPKPTHGIFSCLPLSPQDCFNSISTRQGVI